MKILFVEYNIGGHHIYLHNLVNSTVYDSTAELHRESLKPEDMRKRFEAVYSAVLAG